MNESAIHCTVQDGTATLTLQRPQVHNAFDDVLIGELSARLRALGEDPQVRVVVLGGAGRSFCAGADLAWMRRMAAYGEQENRRDARALAELMHTLDTLSKPTVARVHGAAYGGGVGLVACCDIAIAADGARFCTSEARLGLAPAVISPYVVRAIGARAARRYFLTAAPFDASRAHALGLVHEVVDAGELDRAVAAVVAELHAGGPAAQTACKSLIATVAGAAGDETLIDYTAACIADLRASAEGQEGIRAFLDKRTPAWCAGDR